MKIRYFDRGLSERLKKLSLLFLSNPVPFNGQSYKKQKGSWNSHQSLFGPWNQFRKIALFVIFYLTKSDDVMYSSFWVIPKIPFANSCKSIHDIINYSTFIWPFEHGKCGKEGGKTQKIKYLENEKSFLNETKTFL